MHREAWADSAIDVWIPLGSALFAFALITSAVVVPQLRALHALQVLIYVAVVGLARRRSAWGLGAGVTIAVAWNSLNLFVTHLMQAGVAAIWSFLRTGVVRRPDTMMVAVGTVGHFVLIVGCLVAMFNLQIGDRKWWKFAGGGVLVLAYFALIISVAAPR